MARDFTASFETELSEDVIKPRILWEGDFGSQVVNLWTGESNISWDSKTWLGNGWLHDISAIKEVSEVQAVGARVTLTGVPSELVSLVLQNDNEQGALGKLYFMFLDDDDAIIADPHLFFSGGYDYSVIQESADIVEIEIHYESALAALRRPKVYRYTDESQRALYPNDRGFEYTAFLKEWSGYWGQQENPNNA